MVEQITGVASVLVLILGYAILVQALMAATVLLTEFIVLRIRALRSLLMLERPEPPAPKQEHERAPYGIGGGLIR